MEIGMRTCFTAVKLLDQLIEIIFSGKFINLNVKIPSKDFIRINVSCFTSKLKKPTPEIINTQVCANQVCGEYFEYLKWILLKKCKQERFL